eukprot:5500868-Prymnesium_polylepis.1
MAPLSNGLAGTPGGDPPVGPRGPRHCLQCTRCTARVCATTRRQADRHRRWRQEEAGEEGLVHERRVLRGGDEDDAPLPVHRRPRPGRWRAPLAGVVQRLQVAKRCIAKQPPQPPTTSPHHASPRRARTAPAHQPLALSSSCRNTLSPSRSLALSPSRPLPLALALGALGALAALAAPPPSPPATYTATTAGSTHYDKSKADPTRSTSEGKSGRCASPVRPSRARDAAPLAWLARATHAPCTTRTPCMCADACTNVPMHVTATAAGSAHYEQSKADPTRSTSEGKAAGGAPAPLRPSRARDASPLACPRARYTRTHHHAPRPHGRSCALLVAGKATTESHGPQLASG